MNSLKKLSSLPSHHPYLCFKFLFDCLCIVECYCLCFLILCDLCWTIFDSKVLFIIYLSRLCSCFFRKFFYDGLAVLCYVLQVLLYLYFDANILPSTASHRCCMYLCIVDK
uniref:Uncharacterized protein n=1 Tax=Rhipicephalus zambeziensis TaxID=60191 RepID=A0A224YI01_9ACAR